MEDVIQDPKMKEFVESPVSSDFGLSVEEVAEQVKSYGRFSAWLNGNVSQIIEVLTIVQEQGVSPAFFGAYEYTEGYNAQWGWLNHTTPAGDPFQDAESVAIWVEDQSNSTDHDPAWIDYANYKDFVPDDVKQAGNEHFRSLPTGTIGRVVIAGTAAATWEVYYPDGLKAEYNGVQDYGAPINNMISAIEDWGGVIGGESGGTDPDPNPEPIVDIDFTPITDFFDDFAEDLMAQIQAMIDELIEEIESMLTKDLYKYGNSKTQGNNFLKIINQLDNMYKIKPTLNFNEILNEIIEAGKDNISDSINSGKDILGNVIDGIEPDITYPDDGGNGDGGNDSGNGEKYFPVDFNASGVNFWQKDNYPMGTIQHEMGYGYTRNGGNRFHAGYDIGAGGTTGLDVYATNAGVVQFARWSNSGGFMMQIKHDNDEYYSTYMHLVNNSNVVSVGDSVKAGEKIATMGNTPGGGIAVHLHYVLSKDGSTSGENSTFDPEPYLEVTGDNQTSLPNPADL